MKFICSLVVVEEISRARKLYENLLGQKVIADFGENNVAFEGGLALYQRALYQDLLGADRPIYRKANNFELYFEGDNLAELEQVILRNGYELIHTIREEPWKQQVFRFYDADQNIVVIAEEMAKTSLRLFHDHHSIEDISRLTGLATAEISAHLNGQTDWERKDS